MLSCDPAEGAIEKQQSAQLDEAEADNGGFFEDNDDAVERNLRGSIDDTTPWFTNR